MLTGIANTLHVGGSSIESNLIEMYYTAHTQANIKQICQQWDTAYTLDTGNNNQAITDPQQKVIRRLTPRECFRLQGYPDTYTFICSDSQLYKQIGNSITIPLVSAIIKEIRKQILGDSK